MADESDPRPWLEQQRADALEQVREARDTLRAFGDPPASGNFPAVLWWTIELEAALVRVREWDAYLTTVAEAVDRG